MENILPFLVVTILFLLFISSSSSSPLLGGSRDMFKEHTGLSDFRVINRRFLSDCPDPNHYIDISVVGGTSPLPNEANVTVTVSGVLQPDASDWIAMISPSDSDVNACLLNDFYYLQTGDLSSLPLLCHYPVKAQFLKNDPSYLSCQNKVCTEKDKKGNCAVQTCTGTLTFDVINFRTDVEFVFFTGGFMTPCIMKRSQPIRFANPSMPLYGHLSSIDSTGTSMKLRWVSGDKKPQQVQYGNGKSATSSATTFTKDDMCTSVLASPAKDFGWHNPGFIHTAIMTGLQSSQTYTYKYGSNSVSWSNQYTFKTPPASGSDKLQFIAYGDMGKTPLDPSAEHYIQPGALSVVNALKKEVASGNYDSIFHIGDISYATGFLIEWDYFLRMITPLASRMPYMTAIGNHERDYGGSGSVYITPDSGGECGVAYETYFPMPTAGKDKPWYSIEQAGVHFTIISTENDWTQNSEQYEWIKKDLSSVNRKRTPWVIFMGHRPMYSHGGMFSEDPKFTANIEPLLMNYRVDLVLFAHVHNYERTCAVYKKECKGMPRKDKNGIDTYDSKTYTAPVHAVIGMAGFKLNQFKEGSYAPWSLSRIAEFGYVRAIATKERLSVEFVNSDTAQVRDRFQFIR